MAFQLRILFDGLCVFVPNVDESKGVRVLMIDARAPGVASNGENHVSHVPSVRFALADLAPGRKQPAHRVDYPAQDPVPRGQWYLNGDDLEIRVNGAGLPDAPLTVLRKEANRDFSLIPSMPAIYPETHGVGVKDECLSADLRRLADAGLVGRLRLQAGVLGAWDGAGGHYISPDEYMFTGNPNRHRQRIASRSFFETEIAADEVELFSRQRGHGLVFRPADGERVEILIENEPPMELMPSKPSDPDADYDFELVYLIAKNPPLPLRIPVRATAAWEAPAASAESTGATTICAPVTYSPSKEAAVTSRPICAATAYNPSEEAGAGAVQCMGGTFNPSEEAGGLARPICYTVAYNPSEEAGRFPVICMSTVYNPSAGATAQSHPVCAPATYNASEEASASARPICAPVTYSPSKEAGAYSRPVCTATAYNPSEEAGPANRPICAGVVYSSSRVA
jgi:hypothetical protein